MNSFIFGFQRLVWCPKWTPASSSSFMVIVAKQPSSGSDCIGSVGLRLPDYSRLLPRLTMWRGRENKYSFQFQSFKFQPLKPTHVPASATRNLKLETRNYRFDNWNRLRAPFWQYFLRCF